MNAPEGYEMPTTSEVAEFMIDMTSGRVSTRKKSDKSRILASRYKEIKGKNIKDHDFKDKRYQLEGNIGMYDTVTATFFANQGTNPFISGGEAQTSTYQDGDVVTITDVGITLTYTNGNLYFSTNESLTLSQFNTLCSICKGANGVVVTITDLGITLTSNGTDWYVTSNITIPTLSQATQLFTYAKGDNGVTVTVTSTGYIVTGKHKGCRLNK